MSDWALNTEDDSSKEKHIPINGKMIIGRDKSCDIVIDKDEISRKHAEIEVVGDVLIIKDLGSVNGTFLNDKKIEQVEASPCDEVRFDVVKFSIAGPVVESYKTVVREAISVPAADPDATRVNPAISIAEEKEKGTEATVAQKAVPAPAAEPPPQPVAQPETKQPEESKEDPDKKTGVWQQTEETESGTLVLGVISEPESVPSPVNSGPADSPNGTTGAIGMIKYSLSGTKPPVQGIQYLLSDSRYIIGRTDSNDIIIDETSVSSRHAELLNTSGSWSVSDLGSLNGVFVNGKKITKSELSAGDKLWIGRVEFRFDVDSNENHNKPQLENINSATNQPETKKSNTAVFAAAAAVIVAIVIAVGYIMSNKDSETLAPITQSGQATSAGESTGASVQVVQLWRTKLTSRSTPSTPALGDVDGDNSLDIVIVDNKGWVRAFSGVQGKQFLEKKISGKLWAAPTLYDLTGDGVKEIVIASDNGIIYVLNGKGQQLWATESNIGIAGVYNRLAIHDVNNDKTADIIVPSSRKGLVALDGNRGWELWNTASITKGMIINAPLIADINNDDVTDAVMVTDSGQVLAVSFDGKRVSKLWEQQLPKVMFASPTFSKANGQRLVVIATDKDGLIALDAKTGKRKWQANIPGNMFSSPVAVELPGEGISSIIVASLSGVVYAINSADGKELWNRSLGEKIQASPALFGGNDESRKYIVILDTSGKMHILNSDSGTVISSTKISGADSFVASAVLGDIDNNATIDFVIASQNANIYGYSINNETLNEEMKKGQAVWPLFLGNDRHGVY